MAKRRKKRRKKKKKKGHIWVKGHIVYPEYTRGGKFAGGELVRRGYRKKGHWRKK